MVDDNMGRILLLFWFILITPTVLAATPNYLSGLLIKPSPASSIFTFTMSQKTYGRIKYISDPDRVIIEFANTYKHFDMDAATLQNSIVKSLYSEDDGSGLLRFVLYVNGKVEWTNEFLPADEDSGVRFLVKIMPSKKSTTVLIQPNNNQPRLNPKLQQSFQDGVLSTFVALTTELKNRQLRDDELIGRSRLDLQKREAVNKVSITRDPRVFTVVIDAGHGGKDSGALGVKGTNEKHVVLGIAKKLAREINVQPNMKAILTRDGDYYVPLRGRLNLARKGKADLFIAIHADAYFDNTAAGASVFTLSQHGASSEAARWLAKRDNYSELGRVELDSLSDRDPILRSVLVDLAQTATIQDSVLLGNNILDTLDNISSLHYTHVERAPFVVLKSPDIPSVLVETGFLTNPKEEKRLADPIYQGKIAIALCQGIINYIRKREKN